MSNDIASSHVTTDRTIRRATEDGFAYLESAPGEPHASDVPSGEPIAALWHLSDLHLCDAESPARLEYLDRHGDSDSPHREELGDVGTYRPQEILTVQVAVAMVETVNAVRTGPTTGIAIDGVVLTGDIVDNAQDNELGWYQQIVEGGVLHPWSGNREHSSWVGVTHQESWDERYWHPDGPPAGTEADRPSRVFGFPKSPGLIEAARREVVSPGLALDWVTVHGNHDLLLQGTVAVIDDLQNLATGDVRILDLPPGVSPRVTLEATAPVGPARYPHNDASPRATIEPDNERRLLEAGDFPRITRHSAGPAYYATDLGALRLVCLDTVNPHGGWQGSIDEEQLDWLTQELVEAADRYTVVLSHHPSITIINDYRPAGAPDRVLGDRIVETLSQHRNVIAWLAGHVHFHAAHMHGDSSHEFVEITTSSLIDWPQQGRILEFVKVHDRDRPEVAIISSVVDHRAPAQWPSDLEDHVSLASVSRTLAANDYRIRDDSLRRMMLDSTPEFRNNVWRVADPFS